MSPGPDVTLPRYLAFWGKARPRPDSAFPCHPLPYHSLDVAAVGAALLDGDRRLASHLSSRSGMPPPVLRRWLLTWLAWHDLGKFSPAFQRLAPEASDALANPIAAAIAPPGHRHDAFGWWLVDYLYRRRAPLFDALSDRPLGREGLSLVRSWSAAVTGHHGTPPDEKPATVMLDGRDALYPPPVLAAVDSFMAGSTALFANDTAPLPGDDRAAAIRATPRFSWMRRPSLTTSVPGSRGDEPLSAAAVPADHACSPLARG